MREVSQEVEIVKLRRDSSAVKAVGTDPGEILKEEN
jgi:hypothetical protein